MALLHDATSPLRCALAYGSPALSPEMISEFISDAIDEMGKDVAAAAVLSPKATQIINTALPYELSVLKVSAPPCPRAPLVNSSAPRGACIEERANVRTRTSSL
jgi:hypothetical protein